MSRFTPVNSSANRSSITPSGGQNRGSFNLAPATGGHTVKMANLISTTSSWQVLDKFAIALYHFEGFNRFEIPLQVGDRIKIEEEIKGWYKGYVVDENGTLGKKGIFPASYVRAGDSFESLENEFDVVMVKVHNALENWLNRLQTIVSEQNVARFNRINPFIVLLSNLRQKLLTNINDREPLKSKAREIIAGGEAAFKEELPKPKPAPQIITSAPTKQAAPAAPSAKEEPSSNRPVSNRSIAATPAKTLRALKTNIYQQFDWDQGMISFYQKHVEQRNKLANQLKDSSNKSTSQHNLMALVNSPPNNLRSSRENVTTGTSPGSPRRLLTDSGRDAANQTSYRNLKLVSMAASESEKDKKPSPHQILIDIKVFMCSTGDPSELNFSLYNREQKKFISEEYFVNFTAQGMPEDISRIGKLKAVFKDVTDVDINSELYLVCRVIRRGRIQLDKKKGSEYRRPYGCAVLNISGREEIMGSNGSQREHTLPIFCTHSDNDFVNLHEMIPKNENVIPAPHAKGIVVGISHYKGDYEDVVNQHQDIKDIMTVSRFGFPDMFLPGLQRHDFYVTMESAEINKNDPMEISAFVKLENGEDAPACIVFGAGEKQTAEFKSLVINKEPNPKYKESINLKLPTHLWDKSHLYFLLKTCSDTSTKEYSFAFLPLTTKEGSIVTDGEHKLQCYSVPKSEADPTFYLKDTVNNKILAKLVKKGEELKVKTLLSSTQLTNDPAMLSLLNWKKLPPTQLPGILNRFTYVTTIEVLKFLKETFDAMFNILDSNTEGTAPLVYNALVFILGILLDEKRTQSSGINMKNVLDNYLKEHFHWNLAHRQLMKHLKQNFEEIDSKPQVSKINQTLKALEYIFKFIITSRLLYMKQTQSASEDVWFKNDLKDLFSVFNNLMKKTDAQFRGAQSIMLKNINALISELKKVFDITDIGGFIKDFVNAIPYSSSVKLLNMEKLQFMHKLIFSDVLSQKESRDIVFPTILSQLEIHLRNSQEDEKTLCILIYNDIVHLLETKPTESESFLPHLVLYIPSIMKAAPTLKGQSRLDVVTCLLTILHLMSTEQYVSLFKHLQSQDSLWGFFVKLFVNFQSFILAPPYPENWVALTLFQYAVTLKMIKEVTSFSLNELSTSRESFFESASGADSEERKNKQELWKQLFRLAVFFVQAKALIQAPKFGGEARQKEIEERCENVRVEMVKIMKKVWEALGPQRVKYLTILISPCIEIQSSFTSPQLQEVASVFYYNLLETEYEENKNQMQTFPKVESITIETLDKMYSNTSASEEFKEFFFNNLEARLLKCSNGDFQKKGIKYMSDVNYFLELLHALKTLPEGPEYEDDRIIANMKLMEHFKATNRKEAYILHIHKLVEQHEKSGNYTEAAEALLLHARLYKWGDEKLGEISGKFPAQTQRERKEQLYKQAIEYFDKGKMWERANLLIKELREEYQFQSFEYEKMPGLLEIHAVLLKKILSEQRFFAEYYRVGYYGRGFDISISGKEFIYRGLELERREEFTDRITSLFPNAQVLNYTDDPPSDIVNGPGQYLQITSVRPSTLEEVENKPSRLPPRMPNTLLKYYQFNDVNVFVYSKPFRKSQVKSDNEFKDLWLKNTYYITEDTFPTIHRRSQIIRKDVKESHPIENALKTVQEKNRELEEFNSKFANENAQLQSFTMILKGTIDAAVNGGTEKYKDAFFTSAFEKENPKFVNMVKELKYELNLQIKVLAEGLDLHKKKCTAEMMGLQELLEQKYQEMKDKAQY